MRLVDTVGRPHAERRRERRLVHSLEHARTLMGDVRRAGTLRAAGGGRPAVGAGDEQILRPARSKLVTAIVCVRRSPPTALHLALDLHGCGTSTARRGNRDSWR